MKEKVERTLTNITSHLTQIKDDFFIIGASALILSDINIENTEDIDILTSRQDALILQKLWKSKIVSNYIPRR